MRPSILELLKKGHAALRAKHDVEEKTKLGTLRGGSAGAIINGDFYGKCHRLAFARSIGISAPIPWERELMFAAGRTNEDSWYEVLKESWPGQILRETEVPVAWATDTGVPVTGRPDFVLADADGTRRVGIELKLVSSFWTAVDVFVKKHPKSDHLIQAAHYSMALGIPFELWYTSRVDWPVIGWALKQFEKASRWMSNWGEPSFGYNDKGVNKVFPFYQGFELEWDNEILGIRPIGTTSWVSTELTMDSIRSYYNYVGAMGNRADLGPRPASKEITPAGSPMGYNKCDAKYCGFSGICDRHENNKESWVKEAAATFGKGK